MNTPAITPPVTKRVQLGMQSPPNIGGWYGSGFAIGGIRHNNPGALTGDIEKSTAVVAPTETITLVRKTLEYPG